MNVPDKVREIIANNLGIKIEELGDGIKLENLGADSLDKVEIILALEEEFDINIPDEDADKLLSVGEVISYIETRVNEEHVS